MLVEVIPAAHDRKVRLGLRQFRGCERGLATHSGAAMKSEHEQLVQMHDRRVMRPTDRAHGDQLAVQELNLLILERAEGDELVELHASQRADDVSSRGRGSHGWSSCWKLACTPPVRHGAAASFRKSAQATLARERIRCRSKITSAISLSFCASR